MPWRFFGHGRVNPSNPTASGYCDSCDCVYPLAELKFQYEYRGTSQQNTWFRRCPRCLDIPQPQLKPLLLPADPYPVQYPRVGFVQQEMYNGIPATNWDSLYGAWDDSTSTWSP